MLMIEALWLAPEILYLWTFSPPSERNTATLKTLTNCITKFFADDDIADIIEHTPHKRNSVFTPLVTLKAFIFQVLSDDNSCKLAVAGVLGSSM